MGVFEIVGGILMILISIGILLIVTIQESPKGSGVSALTGSDSYYNKNQNRSMDAILSRGTKILAAAFFIVTIAVYAMVVLGAK